MAPALATRVGRFLTGQPSEEPEVIPPAPLPVPSIPASELKISEKRGYVHIEDEQGRKVHPLLLLISTSSTNPQALIPIATSIYQTW